MPERKHAGAMGWSVWRQRCDEYVQLFNQLSKLLTFGGIQRERFREVFLPGKLRRERVAGSILRDCSTSRELQRFTSTVRKRRSRDELDELGNQQRSERLRCKFADGIGREPHERFCFYPELQGCDDHARGHVPGAAGARELLGRSADDLHRYVERGNHGG